MKVYLAGPIFGCTDSECRDWRELAKAKCSEIEFLDPMDRDYRGSEAIDPARIVREDKQAILGCDAIFANLSEQSAGTVMEVMFAWQHHIHVIAWKRSSDDWSPWILEHTDDVCISLGGAIQHCLIPWMNRMKNRRMVNEVSNRHKPKANAREVRKP